MYTTIADRDSLKSFMLPDSLQGSLFRVSIAPLTDDEKKERFRSLKGVLGTTVTVDDIREERLNAYINRQ